MARCSGIYGLFQLDGGPVVHHDAVALGLVKTAESPALSSAIVESIDALEPGCVHQVNTGGSCSILLGYIDDLADLAARLSMRRDSPPLQIAIAAHDRYGDDLPREMMGAWTLLMWDGVTRQLAITQSINARNAVLFVRHGMTLAIAPDLRSLLHLPWVSSDIDPKRITSAFGSTIFASITDDQLFVGNIRTLHRASTLRANATDIQISDSNPNLPITPWRGSFDEAMDAAEQLLRGSVRGVLARAQPGKVGAFNSGGLDSSTLSWLASTEKPTGTIVPLLASAVAPERCLDDEIPFSRIVADHLGEPLYPVIPPQNANPYRPRIADFIAANAPPCSPRNYLYDSFADQALALGLTHILDGAMGELTLTTPMELPDWRRRLHLRLRAVRMRFTHPDLQSKWPDDATLAWLNPSLMASLPPSWRQQWLKQGSSALVRRRGELWGYTPNLSKMIKRSLPEYAPGKLRSALPFLDIRLQQLFAGFPTDYMGQGGLDRAPARHMLLGKLPESISLRPKGLAFSPDYHQRLADHAAGAAARIPLFRKAGLGDWFDLDRLETGLGQVHRFERAQLNSTFKIQMTAQSCEYFLWWVNGRPESDAD